MIRFTAEDLKGAASKEFKYTITEQIPEGATDNGDGTWSVGAVTYDGHTEEVTVTVTINYDGTLSVSAKYSSGDGAAVFTNTENTVRIRKVRDSDGSLLAGAVLQIMDADGRAVYSWTSSAEERTFTLAAGTYRLHEVTAPAGYELAADISFTVTNSGSGTCFSGRDIFLRKETQQSGNGRCLTVPPAYSGMPRKPLRFPWYSFTSGEKSSAKLCKMPGIAQKTRKRSAVLRALIWNAGGTIHVWKLTV